ncbi:tyrosine-type recombinase/integrase [Hyphomonas sp.]|uniref:tyrosine-type recombinase/integrase n=1 Tax=Hyphomonas sp. TaxID=87 RepID=UPI0025BAA570|nr:tyrosine-type recombinase/integrase [Hyphomonas sp.]
MSKVRIKGLSSYVDRHGRRRWRFRQRGYQCPMPDPQSREFADAYAAALRASETGGNRNSLARIPAGTIRALSVHYLQSQEFQALAEATRTPRRRIIDKFVDEFGSLPAARLERQHVTKLISKRSGTPAAANELLKVLRVIYSHGQRHGLVSIDPTQGIRKVKDQSEGHRTWTDDEIEHFRKSYPSGTRERLALELFLCTGQRVSDVTRMGRQHLKGGAISITQQKTGQPVAVPVLPELQAEIDRIDLGQAMFILTDRGAPYGVKSLSQWFVARTKACGLPDGLSPHGLRKACARRLAEAGCSPHEIAAITGHRSLSEVARYSRAADRLKLARQAMHKLSPDMEREQNLANQEGRLANSHTNNLKGNEK